jgi:hypothetical protein
MAASSGEPCPCERPRQGAASALLLPAGGLARELHPHGQPHQGIRVRLQGAWKKMTLIGNFTSMPVGCAAVAHEAEQTGLRGGLTRRSKVQGLR